MGRGSPIPPMLRRKIVEQYQKGVSQRKIAKSLKLSSSTVHNIIQRFRESGTISVRKGQGRKTILDARDLRALRQHCITYRNATVMEITTWAQEYFQKTLSVNTIHRAIRRCRLKLYRSKKKPYLNMIQKRRRFLWAKAHLKWTVAKWKTVLWSDESKFEVLFGKLGRHVIRTKEDKDNPSCYQRSVQKPASLMVWGCMSACGMGSLHIWKGTINAESVGRCQILLENEISIFKKLVSRRKHEVLQNFLVVLDGAGYVLPEYNLESQQTLPFLCWDARKQVTHTSETTSQLHIPAMREREKEERWKRDWTAMSKSIKEVVQ
ncbi:hypothetical protein QTP70_008117 [Hemibagrus guttatus]|uniref:Paired domain-containing protein n=1 Tax=Hemibagrus guttatus TaxID=175788 RepID=A0AAE0V8Q0_9TELE|nr:hypothetical protein QTP70_008117 [Hemibagrus guttatus]